MGTKKEEIVHCDKSTEFGTQLELTQLSIFGTNLTFDLSDDPFPNLPENKFVFI